jgi:MscS family membrane protein
LFSKDTVAEIPDFYELAKGIPYKAGALVGVYEGILASPGQWVPQRFPDLLPGWATLVVGGQGVWQWIALAVLAIVSLVLFRVLIRLGLNWDAARADDHPWLRFGVPIALLVVLVLSVFIQTTAENVIGLLQLPLDLVSYAALAVQLICGSWFVVSVSGRLADAIGRAGAKPDAKRHFDTALMRVLFRLVSLTVMAMLAIIAAEAVGIPIAPLVAGLGVGGLAIALAIRPTLENIIGGLTLFADRPVRVGDFCRYGDNIGTVEEIGLRSTRIRTLENSLVSVPNSEFSQMHLDNFAVRHMRLMKVVLQLRYETTPEQMRYVLAKLRELLLAHPMVTPEPARVRFVGYGTYSKDVEVFAYLRCQSQDVFLAIQEDVLLRMEDIIVEAGTGFAFPSQTNYVARDAGLYVERGHAAEAEVGEWRSKNRLPFPEFEPDYKQKTEDTLDYPPRGHPMLRTAKIACVYG